MKCGECGSDVFWYETDVVLGGCEFHGYTCVKCGNLVFMDKEAMIDVQKPMKMKYDNLPLRFSSIKLDKPR